MISQFASKLGAGIAAIAVLGGVSSTVLSSPAHAATAPAVVADAAASTCGAVELGASGSDAAALKSAADCLQHAYSSCTPNQLAVTWDTATERIDRVLTVSPSDSGCQVVDQVTHTAKSNGQDSTDVYTCGSLSFDANGITARKCGVDGDVNVPLAG